MRGRGSPENPRLGYPADVRRRRQCTKRGRNLPRESYRSDQVRTAAVVLRAVAGNSIPCESFSLHS